MTNLKIKESKGIKDEEDMEVDKLLGDLCSSANKDTNDDVTKNIYLHNKEIELKEFPTLFYKESDSVECIFCDFKGKINLYSKQGGIFVKDNPNRVNIFGCCPKCNKTIISFHLSTNTQ